VVIYKPCKIGICLISCPRVCDKVYCLGHPGVTVNLEIVDECTILCPLCGIDAVVPASQVPDEETMQHWHNLGFSVRRRTIPLKTDSFNVRPDSTTQSIIDSGVRGAIHQRIPENEKAKSVNLHHIPHIIE